LYHIPKGARLAVQSIAFGCQLCDAITANRQIVRSCGSAADQLPKKAGVRLGMTLQMRIGCFAARCRPDSIRQGEAGTASSQWRWKEHSGGGTL
jgi:hypothetical protein